MNPASKRTPTRPQGGASTKRLALHLCAGVLLACSAAAHALKGDTDQPINISARTVQANEKTGVSVYQGNVVVIQGSLHIEADRLEVRMRNGEIERIRAWGKPVRMRSRTDSGEDIRATAQRADYRAKERRMDLYRDVEIHRAADIFTGAVVHYALDDQTFVAEGGDGGRVSAVIQPAKKDTAQ